MSEIGPVTGAQAGTAATDLARQGIEQAQAGEAKGADELDYAKTADAPGTTAVEQETSEGPAGRGLSR